MKAKKSKALMSLGAMVVVVGAALTWSLASEVVVLHPAVLRAQFSYSSELVSHVQVLARPQAGGLEASVTVTAPGSPFSVDVVVDGGDGAAGGSNPGIPYATRMFVHLQGQPETFLYVQRGGVVTAQNTEPGVPDVEPLAMPIHASHRITANVQVLGGRLTSLQLNAHATEAGHAYQGRGTAHFPAKPAAGSVWIPMHPHASVSVSGTAMVEDAAGNVSQRALAAQVVNALAPVTAPTWTVDLGAPTLVHGVIGPNLPAAPRGRTCFYQGRGAAQGIFGNKIIGATDSECLVSLSPPAPYVMYVLSRLNVPVQQAVNTPMHSFTVSGGEHTEIFDEVHSSVHLRVELDGMFDPQRVSLGWGSQMFWATDSTIYSHINTPLGGYLAHVLPVGQWKTWIVNASVRDVSNPELPLSSTLSFYNYNDPEFMPAFVSAGVATDLGLFTRTLGRTHVFFDVKEVAGAPEVLLRNPYVQVDRWAYLPGGSPQGRTYITAQGSSAARSVSALSVMAPPGVYSLFARAEVNGALVTFAKSIIRFGTPVFFQPGAEEVELTPQGDPDLRLDLKLEGGVVTGSGGHSSVVETPVGPEPPEQFLLSCAQDDAPSPPGNGGDFGCTRNYYDVQSMAQTSATSIKICVRRAFEDAENALGTELAMFRYDPTETECDLGMDTDPSTPGCWKDITEREDCDPLPGEQCNRLVVDCADGDNPCQCPLDQVGQPCGANADEERHVFRICGIIPNLSGASGVSAMNSAAEVGLLAVVEKSRFDFSTEVDGVVHAGPDGPAALQHWTVPRTGKYRITATGAKGGTASAQPDISGGCGAKISGELVLQAGEELKVLVGQAGASTVQSGGGGGGTFVVRKTATGAYQPLVIAGGGGGIRSSVTVSGRPGGTGPDGVYGSTSSSYSTPNVAGGTGGSGGAKSTGLGSGGGGWSGDGAGDGTHGEGGRSFLNGGGGGKALGCSGVIAHGGYGGGGSGNGCYGGGGGGGYSGGGAGRVAGGGGSFNAGSNATAVSSVCTTSGHGAVVIERVD